ncbi:hypothetical protein ACFW0P_10725 [Lysobacter soli]|uniref:hypothetical protein n=1 Tax=Lysobacter soli TaxID=453783 RepID=UPI003683F60E
MDLEAFLSKARKLAKPATELVVDASSNPVAFWHGHDRHGIPLITFSYRGSWFEVWVDDTSERVIPISAPRHEGVPLAPSSLTSMPPVDAIFSMDDAEVRAYLSKYRWRGAYNNNFPDTVPSQYEDLWTRTHPLYSDHAAAVLGGWHFPWPDGDWKELADKELVLWTLREAEPWVEVFHDGKGFEVKVRLT